MLENMRFKSTDGSGSLAAAYLLICVALVGVTLLTGISFHRQPAAPLFVFGIGGGLMLLSLLLRMRPELPSRSLWLFTRGRRSPALNYTPRLVKPPAASTFGTNRPPTVEELRDLKDTPRNWVPSRGRSGRASLR